MSNMIRNLLVAGAVVLGGISFGQTAQAFDFDAGGLSFEVGDLGEIDTEDFGVVLDDEFDDDDDEGLTVTFGDEIEIDDEDDE
jgi:hypothetical protein